MHTLLLTRSKHIKQSLRQGPGCVQAKTAWFEPKHLLLAHVDDLEDLLYPLHHIKKRILLNMS